MTGPEGDIVAAISAELTSCRKRGIERLDLRTHNQAPVPAPQLERLAVEYLVVTGRRTQGRIAQIKYLLRDAISAFVGEDEADAKLVTDLFFGDSQNKVTKSAGELLDIARRQSGFGSNEARFRQARHDAFDHFAEFIPRFVASARPGNEAEALAETIAESYSNDIALAPEVQRQVATIGYIDGGEHFISLLSQAENVTTVGFTNESLVSMLRIALARKREAILRSDESWSSIRVVFLSEELLDWVNDERGYPDPDEARLLRRRLGVFGRRTVRVFLRSLPRHVSWKMYETPHLPPLIGTLFEMPDGRRVVQLLFRRRLRNSSDHVYLEFEDTRGHYFSAMFDEIVQSSIDDEKLTPVGSDIGQRFRVTGTRYRWSVLGGGSDGQGWLAMVLILTWQFRDGQAEPLLQLRTQLNSSRELDRLTHPADHILLDERANPGTEFGLDDAIPLAAARRRVQMETGPIDTGQLTPLTTGTYFHHEMEHLFFFVYSCRLPDGLELWPQAEMSPVSVQQLFSIRKNQVLRNALLFCNDPPARRQGRAEAVEIVALNLVLHDFRDLAQKLRDAAAARTAGFAAIVAELRTLEEQTRQTWPGFEQDAELRGLSGFQFREFYTTILPFYRSAGVPGAAEALTLIEEDEIKRAAVAQLSRLYHNQRVMESIPIEL